MQDDFDRDFYYNSNKTDILAVVVALIATIFIHVGAYYVVPQEFAKFGEEQKKYDDLKIEVLPPKIEKRMPDFIEANGGTGPQGIDVRDGRIIEIGDIIQLANSQGQFYHSLIISGFTDNDILICAHSNDALDRPISTYNYTTLRVIHIEKAVADIGSDAIFENLINGISLS